jgi:hypothetical protein
MSTNDPEFYQAPKFTPEPPHALPKQRGCFFYGCLFASILAVLMAIVLGVGGFLAYRVAYRALSQVVEEYTSTTPRELPKAAVPAEQIKALRDRIEAFRKAVEAGTSIEPLVLNSDDVNALINDTDELKGMIYVKIEGDELKGQVSIPLDRLIDVGMVRGRYLNGEADLKASLSDGVLIVTLDGIEVNGKRPPDEIMKKIRQENLAKGVYQEEKNASLMRKLESLEVKDGKIIVRVRAKGASATESSPTKKDIPVEIVAPPSNGEPKAEPAKKADPPPADQPKAEVRSDIVEKPAPKS